METEQHKYIRLMRHIREKLADENGGMTYDEFKLLMREYKDKAKRNKSIPTYL